jgi:hypothetical protein
LILNQWLNVGCVTRDMGLLICLLQQCARLVEAKELLVFLGRNLDGDEITVVCGPTDA